MVYWVAPCEFGHSENYALISSDLRLAIYIKRKMTVQAEKCFEFTLPTPIQ